MGKVDIYNSRRKYHQECRYWVRDEDTRNVDFNELVHKQKSSGVFYARTSAPININGGSSAGVFMDDKQTCTIETEDDISDIGFNSVVEYRCKYWIVDSVQKKIMECDNEFSNEEDFKYYITMRC